MNAPSQDQGERAAAARARADIEEIARLRLLADSAHQAAVLSGYNAWRASRAVGEAERSLAARQDR